jgi:hypothetical protein
MLPGGMGIIQEGMLAWRTNRPGPARPVPEVQPARSPEPPPQRSELSLQAATEIGLVRWRTEEVSPFQGGEGRTDGSGADAGLPLK